MDYTSLIFMWIAKRIKLMTIEWKFVVCFTWEHLAITPTFFSFKWSIRFLDSICYFNSKSFPHRIPLFWLHLNYYIQLIFVKKNKYLQICNTCLYIDPVRLLDSDRFGSLFGILHFSILSIFNLIVGSRIIRVKPRSNAKSHSFTTLRNIVTGMCYS